MKEGCTPRPVLVQPLLSQAKHQGTSAMASNLAVALLGFAAGAAAQTWPSEEPFWPRYDSRNVQVLNGTWSFGFGPGTCDPTSVAYDSIMTPNTTLVPSSFDVAPPGVLGPRLPCIFFRSTHACTPGSTSLVKFYAVNHYARVFMDGATRA